MSVTILTRQVTHMYSPEQVIGEVYGRISYVLSKSARKDFNIIHL